MELTPYETSYMSMVSCFPEFYPPKRINKELFGSREEVRSLAKEVHTAALKLRREERVINTESRIHVCFCGHVHEKL